jgi:hypothetical protein
MTDEAFAAQQAKMSIDQLNAAIDKEVSTALAAHNAHSAVQPEFAGPDRVGEGERHQPQRHHRGRHRQLERDPARRGGGGS